MRFAKFIVAYLLVIFALIAGLAAGERPQTSELKLECQERQRWLLEAKVYEEAFMACATRYSNVLYSSYVISERCDEEVGRSHQSRFTITHNLERLREYADKCGEF